jgi:hypothetical protein
MNKRKIDTDSLTIPSIGKTLRYIEWVAIVTSAIAVLSDTSSQPPKIFSNLVVLTLLLSLVPLSLIFPVDRPIWQKRAYILLESVLILLTAYSKYNLELNLYLIYAKACLLLRRKDIIIIVIAIATPIKLDLPSTMLKT